MFRKFACWSVVVLFGSWPCYGQEWARKMFEVTEHDFGTVARSAQAEFAFVLKNIYAEDVHIAGVRSSCGCTLPRVEREWLKTYEQGAVIAKFNTQAFQGQRGATLTVTFDKPYFAEVQLHVRGYIRNDVAFEPGSVQFGAVDQGSGAEAQVAVVYSGWGDWQITGVRSPNPHLQAAVVQRSATSGRVVHQLRVRLDEQAPPGYLKEHLLLVTNDRNQPNVPLLVEGRVISGVTISPDSLFLGVVAPGQTVTKQLVVKGKRPFRVLAVKCDDPSFRCELPEEHSPRQVHVIPITFVAQGPAGKVVGKIRIETDLESARPELAAFALVADR